MVGLYSEVPAILYIAHSDYNVCHVAELAIPDGAAN
jgi:hypothetical protein